MAGHSKWNNIKNRKGAQDAKKGQVFSQLAKLIRVATKEGQSDDPKSNPSLRLVLEKARAANIPKEKIQKALDKGMGRGTSGRVEEILYEGFAPGGVGVMIAAVTDNKQRTGSEIRTILSKAGGSIGSPNSVSYMFTRLANGDYEVAIPMEITDPDQQEKLETLFETLRENEDVEEIFTVAVFPETETE